MSTLHWLKYFLECFDIDPQIGDSWGKYLSLELPPYNWDMHYMWVIRHRWILGENIWSSEGGA